MQDVTQEEYNDEASTCVLKRSSEADQRCE